MVKRHILAYQDCNNNRCVQLDSWLQDVNGDTRLDIIQKRKVTKKRSGKTVVKPTIYLMGQEGKFHKTKNLGMVNLNDYIMEDLPLNKD